MIESKTPLGAVALLVGWITCLGFIGFVAWVMIMIALEVLIYFVAWALPLALGALLL